MPIVRACRHEMFEPHNEIGIYLRVRQVFVDRNDHTQTSLKIERIPNLKVDSYFVLRLKLFLSACSNNGHGKYNQRRRSQSLESQGRLGRGLVFRKDQAQTSPRHRRAP